MEEKKYVPGDVIAAILYFLDPPFFTGRFNKINETIFELRKTYSILKCFPFSINEVYPFSRRLEDVLHRLELSRVIGMENPDFTRFVVKNTAKEYLRNRILPLFDKEEKKQLQEMAKVFQEKCGSE